MLWSGRRDSNSQPPAWKAGALPLSYTRTFHPPMAIHFYLADGGGFEPPFSGPKPDVLPLDDPPSYAEEFGSEALKLIPESLILRLVQFI